MNELSVVRGGLVGYESASLAQKALANARRDGTVGDLLLLLEHPPVYTKGRRTTADELPMGEDWYRMQGFEIAETDRGGRLTYHGPGQIVGYPIVNLSELGLGVREFVERMETAMIGALAEFEVSAGLIEGLTGVWVGNQPPPQGEARKIGSIGLHVRQSITTHGLAINVNNDLQPFEWVTPCGIEACRMTSVAREQGAEQDIDAFATALAAHLAAVYGLNPGELAADELAKLVPEASTFASSVLTAT